jgi:hypothetical protein
MSVNTKSNNWQAISIVSASGGLGLNGAGTVYLFHNKDNGDKFLFLLADFGLGGGFGIRSEAIGKVLKTILNSTALYNFTSYSDIPANRTFSASDLHLSRGAEATIGVTLLAGYSYTAISGFPFFSGPPKSGEVNNDYFSGANVSGKQFGIGGGAAYRFFGSWFKLWNF